MAQLTRAMLLRLYLLVLLAVPLAGCQIVEGIFKVGMWVGIILVLLVVAAVFFVVNRVRR